MPSPAAQLPDLNFHQHVNSKLPTLMGSSSWFRDGSRPMNQTDQNHSLRSVAQLQPEQLVHYVKQFIKPGSLIKLLV